MQDDSVYDKRSCRQGTRTLDTMSVSPLVRYITHSASTNEGLFDER